jgi:N-methylhydantoinase B
MSERVTSPIRNARIASLTLAAAAEEMKVVLAKTAYSPLLKLAGDYSCGIFDVRGEMVAQGPDLPIHLGSMPHAVKAVIRAWPVASPGDVFIHNDPYHGGSHLPDVNVVTPAFHGDTLLGFACVRAHWPDIGSATPGSYGATTEIFGEGLRLPPLRLYVAGEPNRDVHDLIFANVRTPEERQGDMRAQVAANRRAVLRLSELADKYGADGLMASMREVLDYAERMMRAALLALPDGEGRFEDFLDGDGILENGDKEDRPFWVRMRVEKRGDGLIVDFAGTDPQVAGPMNAPLNVTASGVYTAVKMVVDPRDLIPANSGCWRPITLLAQPGTVVHAQAPAPVVYANHEMSHRVCDMLMGALAPLLPDRVMACSQGTSAILTLGGVDPRSGQRYVSYETIKGGFGARPVKDGINGVASGISNTMNTPVEILEMSFPVRVERYAIVPDSGGAGRHRGGAGAERAWRMLADSTVASVCLDRTRSAPFGLMGGAAGAPGRVTVVDPDGSERRVNEKGSFTVLAGGLVCLRAPGSGGYGPAAARPRDRLRQDVVDGYVTPAAAARDYGAADPAALDCPRCARVPPREGF